MGDSLRVQARFWGPAARLAGASSLQLTLGAPARVADAVRALAEVPGLAEELPRYAFAVGDTIVRHSHLLQDGDELSVLPPVSGG